MYITQDIANRIRKEAKRKKLLTKEMLSACGLSINTISELSKGKQISFVSLAKIADNLECSVDYLLGRTEDPNENQPIILEPEEYPAIVKYRAISEKGREVVDKLLDDLYKQKNAPTAYSDERVEAILQNRPELAELVNQIRMLDREQTLKAIDYIQNLRSQEK